MGMPVNAKNSLDKLRMGPTQVVFDPDDTSIELFLRGGVDLNFIRGQEVAESDLVGVYDVYTTGDSVEFQLTMPEDSLEVLGEVFPEQDNQNAAGYFGFGKAAGVSLRATAKKVRFRRWQDRTNAAEQVEIWLAVPFGDAVKVFSVTEGWSWQQTFKALPDLNYQEGQMLAKITCLARAT